jgi:hypothetical protein
MYVVIPLEIQQRDTPLSTYNIYLRSIYTGLFISPFNILKIRNKYTT